MSLGIKVFQDKIREVKTMYSGKYNMHSWYVFPLKIEQQQKWQNLLLVLDTKKP